MIRLNCDLGEGYGRWQLTDEAAVMPWIDMANIACGFHAGDPLTLTRTLRLASRHGVSVGAHPGYPDLLGFGRRSIPLPPEELRSLFLYQIGALRALARAEGLDLEYVKPHGALYNDMMCDEGIFRTLLEALADYDPALRLMILASATAERYETIAAEHGIGLIREFFADRAYTDACELMPRSETGAVIHDPQRVLERVRQAVERGTVLSAGGREIPLRFETICVHGDNPEAVELTRSIHRLLHPQEA
jgi:UPF0271 protein